jgi:hypothetical protein
MAKATENNLSADEEKIMKIAARILAALYYLEENPPKDRAQMEEEELKREMVCLCDCYTTSLSLQAAYSYPSTP